MYRSITCILFLFTSLLIYSQNILVITTEMKFDGKQLTIPYKISGKSQNDRFFVWIVFHKRDGQVLNVKALSGDIGDVNAGDNKKITWIPENDSLTMNEEITFEIKAEKYLKSYNKGGMLIRSVVLPGWGQTKMSNGKPYWLIGACSYGALAGGLVIYGNSRKTYDKYILEEDRIQRNNYLNTAERDRNLSGYLFTAGAVILVTDLVWTALAPARYKPLNTKSFTFQPYADPINRTALLSLNFKF